MRWVGLDLQQRYITACALDDAGQVVAEQRRLAPEVVGLVTWLQALGDTVTVAMEATLYGAWLHDQLQATRDPRSGGASVSGEESTEPRFASHTQAVWAGVAPRKAKLEARAPRDPGPLASVRPVCAATRELTRRRF